MAAAICPWTVVGSEAEPSRDPAPMVMVRLFDPWVRMMVPAKVSPLAALAIVNCPLEAVPTFAAVPTAPVIEVFAAESVRAVLVKATVLDAVVAPEVGPVMTSAPVLAVTLALRPAPVNALSAINCVFNAVVVVPGATVTSISEPLPTVKEIWPPRVSVLTVGVRV
jgi:hypothetical protein